MSRSRNSKCFSRIAVGAAAILLGASLCLSTTGGTAAVLAAESSSSTPESSTDDSSTFDDGTLTYKILNSKEVSVAKCDASATHVSVMPEIDGYIVTQIGDEAFANCTSLQAVSIPTSVTTLGDGAFYGCTALETVSLPDGVTDLPDGVFCGCSSLKELKLGNAVQSIGDMAFAYCTALTEITLPDTLETLSDRVFYSCTALESVSIPEKVTELGGYTFYNCASLKEFTIPKTLEDMGQLTFLGCQSMDTITVEDGNPTYTVKDNVLYNTDQNILYYYPAGREDITFAIPDDVLVVYAGAFFMSRNLTEVTFGAKTQYIGEMAFDFCDALKTLTIPETVTTIKDNAFSYCSSLETLTFSGADDADSDADKALEIGDFSFFACEKLMDARLPKRVSSIGKYAFGCTLWSDGDSESSVSVETNDGSSLSVKAVDGFLLTGYTGAAADYVKSCDLKLNFKSLNFDWARLVFYVGICAAALAVVFIAVRIVRHNMMTAEEKKALAAAQAEQKVPLSQRGDSDKAEMPDAEPDDGYRSILADDEDEEDAAEAVPQYEDTISHSQLHQIGHTSLEESGDAGEQKAAEDQK